MQRMWQRRAGDASRIVSKCRRPAWVFMLAVASLAGRRSASAFDDAWRAVEIPNAWKTLPEQFAKESKNEAWFRCRFAVPAEWLDRDFLLMAEAADDARQYYVNGRLVGGTGAFPPAFRSGLGGPERFAIPRDGLSEGDGNVLAVRVFLREARTNFNVAAPVVVARPQAIHLKGAWQMRTGGAEMAHVFDAADAPLFRDAIGADQALATWKRLEGDRGPLSIDESLAGFRTPDDLQVELAVGEPHVRQPLSMKFDARGRLWVLEYLQYPSPAGLTTVSRDKFLRAVYDKVPKPPPHHDHGADTISIHEDTDGDGRYDAHRVFVDNLNMASSFAFDADGLWVLNPPYLLFYPDHDRDDRPDGDPDVHLEGFGLEDSHAIANSLRWGNDGWLYAAQGSTVTGHIRRYGSNDPPVHSMGQLIWRYHPPTRRYEVFAEGGGNTFGVEIDSAGRVFSGHNGGDTRGFHYVQGGYSQKGFGKHGELSNPHAYGYFPQMAHHSVPRFTHTFLIYEGGALPEAYEGLLFGVAPLLSHVVMSKMEPDRSSYKTRDVGLALSTDDPWFRPVDIQSGPDGAVYVADFYEQRIDHAAHYQGRIHRESGRIYRIRAKSSSPSRPENLERLSSAELVERLADPNRWRRETAARLVRERRDASVAPALRERLAANPRHGALESLWLLHQLTPGGLDEPTVLASLSHANPLVRMWTVRLACDDGGISSRVAESLTALAASEPDVQVRGQLASSARRVGAQHGMAVVGQLARRDEDAADIHVPLLIWWAIEAHADRDRDAVLALFADESFWKARIVADTLLERIMRRYASTGAQKDLLTAARLLRLAPDDDAAKRLVAGFEKAFEGRLLVGIPAELADELARRGGGSLVLRMRQGDADAAREGLAAVVAESTSRSDRLLYIQVFGQIRHAPAVPVLLEIVEKAKEVESKNAALNALQHFMDDAIADRIIGLHDQLPDAAREPAQTLLASRPAWAVAFLEAVRAGRCRAALVEPSMVKRMQLIADPRVGELTRAVWGELAGSSTEEMRASMERWERVIGESSGNPYNGRKLFASNCGKCHTLFRIGGEIGPDLTPYRRDDLKGLLANIVNPSLEIREGFENYLLITADGRTLNGFLADQDAQTVTLRGAEGQSTTVARDEIEDLRAIPRSIMPEGALGAFTEQEVRDLFAYLRASQPLPD